MHRRTPVGALAEEAGSRRFCYSLLSHPKPTHTQAYSGAPLYLDDVALVLFDEPVVGVTPPAVSRDALDWSTLTRADLLASVGYGVTESGHLSSVLRGLTLRRVANDACVSDPQAPHTWLPEQVHGDRCAAAVFCMMGLCQQTCSGDSGSPLIDATGLVHGVVSRGESECGSGQRPTIFARADNITALATAAEIGLATRDALNSTASSAAVARGATTAWAFGAVLTVAGLKAV